jgi:biotin transporter BioY
MYIVAIGWIYVILMMLITETSVTAGVMTFLLYGILPLVVILYLMNTPGRRLRRKEIEKRQIAESGLQDHLPSTDTEPS